MGKIDEKKQNMLIGGLMPCNKKRKIDRAKNS